MTSEDAGIAAAATLSGEDWSEARARPLDRDPEGRSLRGFRWSPLGTVGDPLPAQGEGRGVLLFPRLALEPGTPPPPVLAAHAWRVRTPRRPVSFCYWIAHALRQDLWRAIRGRSAFLPVVEVRLSGNAVAARAAALGSAGVGAGVLSGLFAPAGSWTAWALAKAGTAGR